MQRIIGFRNRFIYGYVAIDDAAEWGVTEGHLLRLAAEIEAPLGSDESKAEQYERKE